jgi:DNA-binding transcriptional regulator WhiA
MIGTDCIGSCKSNYHTITATMAPGCALKHGRNYDNEKKVYNVHLYIVMVNNSTNINKTNSYTYTSYNTKQTCATFTGTSADSQPKKGNLL